jgi:hypothetical protein
LRFLPDGLVNHPVSRSYLIECADVEEAIAVAAEHPTARLGAVELRRIAP